MLCSSLLFHPKLWHPLRQKKKRDPRLKGSVFICDPVFALWHVCRSPCLVFQLIFLLLLLSYERFLLFPPPSPRKQRENGVIDGCGVWFFFFLSSSRAGKGVFSAMKLGKARPSKDDHRKQGMLFWGEGCSLLQCCFLDVLQIMRDPIDS